MIPNKIYKLLSCGQDKLALELIKLVDYILYELLYAINNKTIYHQPLDKLHISITIDERINFPINVDLLWHTDITIINNNFHENEIEFNNLDSLCIDNLSSDKTVKVKGYVKRLSLIHMNIYKWKMVDMSELKVDCLFLFDDITIKSLNLDVLPSSCNSISAISLIDNETAMKLHNKYPNINYEDI